MYLSIDLFIHLSIKLSIFLSIQPFSAEDASCTAPATKNASVQILYRLSHGI